ncbi:MAG TPA: alpha/beta fold hydrolase [Candidatus Acidoferrum sp.]|nr:alpha/beta fold hydrolase [Candidatus Acidoferrum sp.]
MIPGMGPYPVGFSLVEQYDRSRGFKADERNKVAPGEQARPVQTLIWYPAKPDRSSEMTFGDYVMLQPTETDFSAAHPSVGETVVMGDAFKAHYAEKLQTYRGVAPADGRYPVVIYAPSATSFAWENVDLCRYLASHGYVVIASPGMGEGRKSTSDQAGVDAQANDISFLVSYAATLSNTDVSKVAVAGFSWGGLAELFAAARDDRIKALIALDGSFRYFPWLVTQSKDVRPDAMKLPLLYFKGQWELEDQAHEYREQQADIIKPNVLNSWIHGDLVSVQMLGLFHPEFNSATHRLESFWEREFDNLQRADYDRNEGRLGYAWVTRYTLAFVDAYLKGDAKARAFLQATPRENGVPIHTMAIRIRKAVP